MKTVRGILELLLLLVILIPAFIYFTLRIPEVQNYIVHKVTNAISAKTGTRVSIRSIDYSFFNKLLLNDVLIEDTQGDTLLLAGEVRAGLANLNFSGKSINLSSIKISNGQFNLITDTTGLNLDKLLSRLASADTTASSGSKFNLNTSDFELANFRFTMQNRTKKITSPRTQIDFDNLQVDSIYLTSNGINIRNDTIFFNINDFHFKEKSGFNIHKITTKNAYVCSSRVYLPQLRIKDDYTDLRFKYFAMNYPNGNADIGDFLNRVVMEADIASGNIAFKTIGFFANDLLKTDLVVSPVGKIKGTVADIKAEDLDISSVNGKTTLCGRFYLKGLPNINNTIFDCEIRKLNSTVENLSSIMKQITGQEAEFLKTFEPAEFFTFEGTGKGYYNQFTVDGSILTPIGNAKTHADFNFKSPKNNIEITGHLALKDFDLGKLFYIEDIKRVSLDIEMRGEDPIDGDFKMYAEGNIAAMTLNNYNYQNVQVAGTLSNRAFDGKITADDPNLKMDFLGRIDMKSDETDDYRLNFSANVKYADLHKLNIKTDDIVSKFAGNVAADFRAKDMNFKGTFKLSNAKYTDSEGELDLGNTTLTAGLQKNEHRIQLKSDFFEASYKGNANVQSFISDLQTTIARYIPNITTKADTINHNANYEFLFKTRKAGNIARIFIPNLFVAENSTFSGNMQKGELKNIKIQSSVIYIGEDMIKNINVSGNADKTMNLSILCDEAQFGIINLKNIKSQNKIFNNKISSKIEFDDKVETGNRGEININTNILRNNENNIYYNFDIKPSWTTVSRNTWNIGSNSVTLDGDLIKVDNFNAICNNQKIKINGAYSPKINDTISLELDEFEMSNLNSIFESEGYNFEGIINGKAQFSSSYGKPVFIANINTSNLIANNWLLGKISVLSQWNNDTQSINFLSSITKNGEQKLLATGNYKPSDDYFNINFGLNKFEIKSAEPLAAQELNNFEGTISGDIKLQGNGGKLQLLGNAALDSVGLTIDFLQTHYKFSAPVTFNTDKIQMQTTNIVDTQGNIGRLSATISHKYLKDFSFDISILARNLMAMNTTAADNDQFYGKAFVSGPIKMSGPLDNLKFDINIQPEKNTKIVIPTESTSIGANTLLKFEQFDKADMTALEEYLAKLAEKRAQQVNKQQSDLEVSLNIGMNPNAEIQLLIDQRSGDAIIGTGSGVLRMSIVPRESKFKLYGTYTIDKGNYKLTIPSMNFITKEFDIDNGGQILFNGNVEDTKLDITAVYNKLLRVSLKNLLASDTTTSSAKYPVMCKLKISDNISNLTLKPEIEIQNIDVDTKARAISMLNTDERMLNQFLSLLAFGNFYPEQQIGTISSSESISSNLSEMLSNQLSTWLSALKVPFDVGFNLRTGSNSETEFDVNTSFQLFDDRVQVNANVGSVKRSTTSDIAGDFDVDIKLKKESENPKLKIFSHSTDAFSDELEGSRQGVGIYYRGEFNTWKELWTSIAHPQKLRERRKNIEERRRQAFMQDSAINATDSARNSIIKFDSIPKSK